jgi:hypothetical protein
MFLIPCLSVNIHIILYRCLSFSVFVSQCLNIYRCPSFSVSRLRSICKKYVSVYLLLYSCLNMFMHMSLFLFLSHPQFFINVQMSSLLYSVSMSISMKANTFLSSWLLYVHTVCMSLFLSVSLWQFPGCPRLGYACCCLPFLLCLPPHPTTHSSFYTPATPSTLQLPIYGLHSLPPFPPPTLLIASLLLQLKSLVYSMNENRKITICALDKYVHVIHYCSYQRQ